MTDLQLGAPEFELPKEITPADLATAPPEIKEMVEKTQRHFKAKEKLKQLGTNGVPLLLNLLWTSKGLKEKEQALIALDHLQAPPEMAVAGLTEYLNRGDQAELSALVLARQGPKAIAPLISSRTNRITAVRQAVAWHLAEFHPDENGNLRISINGDERIWRGFQSKADLISPALLELLKDADPTVRFRAAMSLGDVGGDPAVIVPALTQSLKDEHRTVRGDAAAALGKLGKTALSSAPALTRCLYDPDETVRSEAAFALKSIGVNSLQGPPMFQIGSSKRTMIPTPGCYFLDRPEGMSLSGNGHLQSSEEFSTPLVIHTVVKTDTTNIRLYYNRGMVILNWELNPRELRLHDPRNGQARPFPDQGFVEGNKWHEIRWIINSDSLHVMIDGIERVVVAGDYSGLIGHAGIGAAHGSTVLVRNFVIEELNRK